MTRTPPDWDFEIRALLETAEQAGIRGDIRPSEVGIKLESADELISRLKAQDASQNELAKRRNRRRRFALMVSSVAAAGVLVTGVLQPWGSAPVQAMVPAILDYEFATAGSISVAKGKSPTIALQQLADAASAMPEQSPLAGTQHVVTDNWYADIEAKTEAEAEKENSALVPQISESWLAPDGSLRIVERRDDPLPADGRGLPANGEWDVQPATADETQPPGSVDPDLAADLPTDPDALRTELLELSGCPETRPGPSRSLCLYKQVVNLHRTYVVPPQLDATIWKMLGTEQGFRLLGEVKDRVGRPGVGISLIDDDAPEFRQVLIANPKTGGLLGSEQILIAPVDGIALKVPAIITFTAILESKYVD